MVKNLPTVERSTKIRFGKNCTNDQAENTIVFNASEGEIDTPFTDSVYITPLRLRTDLSDTEPGVCQAFPFFSTSTFPGKPHKKRVFSTILLNFRVLISRLPNHDKLWHTNTIDQTPITQTVRVTAKTVSVRALAR